MRILVINGPNLNMLHMRNKAIYGNLSLEQIEELIKSRFPDVKFEFFQNNSEGAIIDKLHSSIGTFDGYILNPGAFSHTSYAIRDALEIIDVPKIEVHLSNLFAREEFRQVSVTAAACTSLICGLKEFSYIAAVYSIKNLLND